MVLLSISIIFLTEYSYLTKPIEGYIFGNYFQAPSTAISLLKIIGDMFFYFFLSWYFDHTLASNRGNPESILFFLNPFFYFPSLKSKFKKLCLKSYKKQDNLV